MPLYAPPNTDLTKPRVDRIVAEGGVHRVESGTPTTGATLANRLGAPALPADATHVSYVVIAPKTAKPTALPFRRAAG